MELKLIYILLVLNLSFTQGQVISSPPINTAAVAGYDARLNCTASVGTDELQWRHKLNFTDTLIWSSVDEVETDNRFEVLHSSEDQYDLIVKECTSNEGGQYYVRLVNAVIDKAAELTVLSGLTCFPSEPRETQEGADIIVTCETAFYGYHQPSMDVYYHGIRLSSWTYISEDKDFIREAVNFTAGPEHDGSAYECRLSFEATDGDTTEQPLYTDQCETQSYTVYYAVHNVTIYPDAPDGNVLHIHIGDSLNCTGVGNEPPNFDWYCKDSYIYPGSILPITEELSGEQFCFCKAYNFVFGQQKEVEKNITFYASTAGQERLGLTCSLVLFTLLISWTV